MICMVCRGARLQSLDAHAYHKCLDCNDDFFDHADGEIVVYLVSRHANLTYLAEHAAHPLAQICREFLNRGLH